MTDDDGETLKKKLSEIVPVSDLGLRLCRTEMRYSLVDEEVEKQSLRFRRGKTGPRWKTEDPFTLKVGRTLLFCLLRYVLSVVDPSR